MPPIPQESESRAFVPGKSLTPSEFGDEFRQPVSSVGLLPPDVLSYLDNRNLEAYFVPSDGNCLYRAVTFGPNWSKHDLARGATAAYLSGLKQNANVLSETVNEAQIDYIRTDSNWGDSDIGEPQLKGLAEALGVVIEVVKSEDLNAKPLVYGPEPDSSIRSNVNPRVSRLLLHELHYYPLFPKDIFPNRKPMYGKELGLPELSQPEPLPPDLLGGSATHEDIGVKIGPIDVALSGNSAPKLLVSAPVDLTTHPQAMTSGKGDLTITSTLSAVASGIVGAGLAILGGLAAKFFLKTVQKRKPESEKRRDYREDEIDTEIH